jgi:hypothetical protein
MGSGKGNAARRDSFQSTRKSQRKHAAAKHRAGKRFGTNRREAAWFA